MWIHLSSQILSNQFSFGKAEPGRHNKTVTIMTHVSAGKILNSFFFKLEMLIIIITSEDIKFELSKFGLSHGLQLLQGPLRHHTN